MSNAKSWVKFEELSNNGGRFIVSPLTKGMGNTIGNAIRRVLLSSLYGSAITGVRIEGVTHEFSTLPNVVEDVLDIVCNLKGVIFKASDSEQKKLVLKGKGKGVLKAKDIQADSSVQIVNPEHHIATLGEGANVSMTLILDSGCGYRPAQITRREGQAIDDIMIDASFSPIVKVNHIVESIRVGKELDNDQLILDVWTNGSIAAEVGVKKASEILIEKFKLFGTMNQEPSAEVDAEVPGREAGVVDDSVLNMSIDDLELSARSSNCLKRAGIATVGSLIEKDMSELIQIKNFGKKSADEINGKLSQFNLALKG